MVRFCENDESVMQRRTAADRVTYVCRKCAAESEATPEETRILTFSRTNVGASLFTDLIRSAPHDRTCLQVKRDCPQCRRDYLSQVRVGDDEKIIYRCPCGYQS